MRLRTLAASLLRVRPRRADLEVLFSMRRNEIIAGTITPKRKPTRIGRNSTCKALSFKFVNANWQESRTPPMGSIARKNPTKIAYVSLMEPKSITLARALKESNKILHACRLLQVANFG